jgi:hypothetical protein
MQLCRQKIHLVLAVAFAVGCGTVDEDEAPNRGPEVWLRSPVLVPANVPVTFDATETSDDEGVLLLRVLFGDGSPEQVFAGLVFSHIYPTPASYEMSVQAQDAEGATSTLIRSLTVVEQFSPPYCTEELPCQGEALCDEGECFLEGP